MYDLAPGSILQRMYLRRRCRAFNHSGGFFYEVGAGNGGLSELLLSLGYCGEAFELNPDACENNRTRNSAAVASGRFTVSNEDFFTSVRARRADLILSSMVIEHLPQADVSAYFRRCAHLLRPGGVVVTLVPAGSQYWGIEDEIAGHFKRYAQADFAPLAAEAALKVDHVAGLTFPVSNMLLPLSNFLVRRAEGHKRTLELQQRTVLSGNRQVPFKTVYPRFLRLLLNERTLWPVDLLQRVFWRSPRCMVLYCEMIKP